MVSMSDWEAEETEDGDDRRVEMMLRELGRDEGAGEGEEDEDGEGEEEDEDGEDEEEEEEAMEVAWARGGTMSEGRTHQRTIEWRKAYTVSSGSSCCESVVAGGWTSISLDLCTMYSLSITT